MRASGTIAVIASDEGLLDSLSFALGVEGYTVIADPNFESGGTGTANLLCVIVDADIYRRVPALREAVRILQSPVIFLADDMPPFPENLNLYQLAKPFQGADLLKAVGSVSGTALAS